MKGGCDVATFQIQPRHRLRRASRRQELRELLEQHRLFLDDTGVADGMKHLTTAGDHELARKIAASPAGMAFGAGTGPEGATCEQCRFFASTGHLMGACEKNATFRKAQGDRTRRNPGRFPFPRVQRRAATSRRSNPAPGRIPATKRGVVVMRPNDNRNGARIAAGTGWSTSATRSIAAAATANSTLRRANRSRMTPGSKRHRAFLSSGSLKIGSSFDGRARSSHGTHCLTLSMCWSRPATQDQEFDKVTEEF